MHRGVSIEGQCCPWAAPQPPCPQCGSGGDRCWPKTWKRGRKALSTVSSEQSASSCELGVSVSQARAKPAPRTLVPRPASSTGLVADLLAVRRPLGAGRALTGAQGPVHRCSPSGVSAPGSLSGPTSPERRGLTPCSEAVSHPGFAVWAGWAACFCGFCDTRRDVRRGEHGDSAPRETVITMGCDDRARTFSCNYSPCLFIIFPSLGLCCM